MGIDDKTLLARYLLGDLSDLDRERLEEQYFLNDETWESLRAAEHDLIDAYVRGELPQRQQEQFENYFLDSSRNRQHLDMASFLLSGELRKRLSAGDSNRGEKNTIAELFLFWQANWHPAVKMAFAAVTVVAAGLALFFAIQNHRLKDDFSAWKAPNGSNNQPIAVPTARPETGRSTEETTAQISSPDASVLSIALIPGTVRSASGDNQMKKIVLSDALQTVVLQLELEEGGYQRYDAVVQSAEGKEIAHLSGLRSRTTKSTGPMVGVKLPAQRLVKGDYIVRLSGQSTQGMQDVDSYTFSVIR